MADFVGMLLQAKVDPDAIENIQKQLNKISEQIKPIEIKFDLDEKKFKDLKLISKQMQKQMANTTKVKMDTSQVEAGVSKVTKHFKGAEEEASRMTKTTKEGFRTIKESIDLVNNTHIKIDVADSYEGIKKLEQKVADFQKKMLTSGNLKGEMDIFASKYKGKYDTVEFKRIMDEVKTLQNIPLDEQTQKMKHLSIEWGQLKQTAMQSGSVISRTIENMGKFMRFYLAGGILVGFVREIRSGIQSVKDLDKSLTELGKVSEMTSSQMKAFTDRAYDVGNALARTGKEVVDATVEFRRAGSDLEEAFTLGQKALLLTNIGSGVDNVTDASSSLIAIMKGFKLEAQDTTHIIDALNEVSNNYALDTVNLTEILKRTSGTLAQTGTSYEELLGLSVGGFESLRNAERVASGLNMISQRLKGMAEDGTRVEGLIPKIQAAFDKYTKGTVSVIDRQNGGLNSTYEILEQLSKIYPTLTDEAKAYINEAVAGNRQNRVLVAIMENWNNVEKAIQSANDSMGSADKSNQAYLESIEGRTKAVVSKMQSFWNNFINADIIKSSISLIEIFITVLDKLINNSFSQWAIQTGLIVGGLALLNKGLVILNGTTIATTIGVFALDVATKGLAGAVGALTASMSINPIFLGATIAIGALVAIIKLTNKYGNSLKNLKGRVEETSSALTELQGEYDTLKSQEKLTDEQKVYLKLLEKEIERKKESLALDSEALLKREFLNKETLKGGGYTVETSSGAEKIQQSIERLKSYKQELKNIDTEQEKGKKQWEEISKKIREIEDDLTEQFKTIVTNIEKIKEFNPDFVLPKELENAKEAIEDILGIADDSSDEIDNADKSFKNLDVTINMFKESVSELGNKLQDLEGIQDKVNDGYTFSYKEISELRKTYPKLEKAIYRTADGWKVEEGALNKVREAMIEHTRKQLELEKENTDNTIKEIRKRLEARLIEARSLSKLIGEEFEDISIMSAEQPKKPMDGRGSTIIENMVTDARNKAIQANKELFKTKLALGDIEKSLRELDDIESGRTSGEREGKKEKSKKEEYKAEADRYARINLELDKNNILLQKNKVLQDLTGDDLEKKLKLMQEEIELNKQRQKSLNDLNNERRKEVKELENSLSKQGFRFTGEGDSRMIANLDNIKGKTKEVEEQFNRYMQLQKDLIPQASQDWWNLQNTIEQVKLDKLITEFEIADKKIEKLNNTLSELEYQFKLLDEQDTSGKSDNIAKQIAVLEHQVKLAKEELEAMGEVGDDALQIVKDRQEELNKRIQDGTLAINGMEKSLEDLRETARQEWIEEKNALAQAQQERLRALDQIQEKIVAIIRKRGEEEKKALDKAHKEEMDSLEERHKERKQKYKDELDEFKKMIQDKIDALDEQYDEEDYLEDLEKERQEAIRLQKEIDILSLDDSLTARNKVIELREQLAKQNEKIAKKQRKRERDLLKKTLQDQLEGYEKDAKDKEDIADNLYENEKKRLEEEYEINKEFLERKYSDEQVYAEAKESIMRGTVEVAEGVFMDIYDAFVDFENKFGRGMGILGDIIKDDFIRELEKAQDAIRQLDYIASNRLPTYDSDYDASDDEIGWKDPEEYLYGKLSSMSKRDYESYVRYKCWWEDAKKQNNKKAMKALNKAAQALRDKYGIMEDLYSYDDLKDLSYEQMKRRGYRHGGKITETGTVIAPFHGTKTTPEWIFNDAQLKNIIQDTVQSTFKLPIPKIPNTTIRQGAVYNIDKIFDISGTVTKDTIPLIRKEANGIEETLKNLNKGGIYRPVKR